MNPHVAVITLGVSDLAGARRFYGEGLGWPILQEDYNWVCFSLGDGSSALALYPWDALAEDTRQRTDSITLATPEAVAPLASGGRRAGNGAFCFLPQETFGTGSCKPPNSRRVVR